MRSRALGVAAVLVAAAAGTASAGGPAYDDAGSGSNQRCAAPTRVCAASQEADAATGRLRVAIRDVSVVPNGFEGGALSEAFVGKRVRLERGDRLTARVRVLDAPLPQPTGEIVVSLVAPLTGVATDRLVENPTPGTFLLRTLPYQRSEPVEATAQLFLRAGYEFVDRGVCGPQPSPCAGASVSAVDIGATVVVEDISVER